jgi:tetratricopeptide (TPR) repeat protein
MAKKGFMTPWKAMISGGSMRIDSCIVRRGWLVAALSIAICLFPVCSHSGQGVVLHPDGQFEFAEQYFKKGEYYRAIGEYERFIYFFPEAEQVELARYRIGLAYLRGERYEEAIEAFGHLIERHPGSGHAMESYLRISEAYVHLKRYDEAIVNLEDLVRIAPDQNIKDEAHYQCGWSYLEKGLREDAETCFNKISPGNREKYRLQQLLQELDKEQKLRRKNPATAGVLGIVPGAGHLYCERPRDALASFLINGALIFAAYEAFDHDQDVLGGIITLVELGFYSGNIYSAVSSAHKFNRHEKYYFLKRLKEEARVNFSLGGQQGDKMFVLSCRVPF